MKLRLAQQIDATALAELEQMQPLAAGWGKEGFCSEIMQNCSIIWCAEEQGKIVGFLALRAAADSAEILNIAVRPEQCRKGIGKRLMTQALSTLKQQTVRQVTLEVAQNNLPACALYEKMGFCRLNVRKDFYGPGCSAWILGKTL